MIIRDKTIITSVRSKNASIAQETLAILKLGYYASPSQQVVDIRESVKSAIDNTMLYAEPLPKKRVCGRTPGVRSAK